MSRKGDQSHKTNWGQDAQNGVSRKSDLGNTNTPYEVAVAVINLSVAPWFSAQSPGRWCEPCVGSGNFYIGMLRYVEKSGVDPLTFAKNFDAWDIDPQAIDILRSRLQSEMGWSEKTVLSLPIRVASTVDIDIKEKYDGIITNPPYLAQKNWSQTKSVRDALVAKWNKVVPGQSARADLFMYFFGWAHKNLNPGGRSIFLCSDSWLDAEYGEPLRDLITDKSSEYEASLIQSWPWKALFRDDTSPIVTVVRRRMPGEKSGKTLWVVDDTNPLNPSEAMFSGGESDVGSVMLSRGDLSKRLSPSRKNRRQAVVTPPDLLECVSLSSEDAQKNGVVFSDLCTIRTFSMSMNDMKRSDVICDLPKEGAIPVMFQNQARVGKPVDYRQHVKSSVLKFGWSPDTSERPKNLEVSGGIWVSQAIDRFPLLFIQSPEEEQVKMLGCSKYMHISFIEDTPSDMILAWLAVLTSTPMLLQYAGVFKEGTRKTLRIDENGFAKEIRKADIMGMFLPDIRKLSKKELSTLAAHQKKKGLISLHRHDVAVENKDWKAIDEIVAKVLSWDSAKLSFMQDVSLALYWRQMRHVKNYGPAIQRVRSKLKNLKAK